MSEASGGNPEQPQALLSSNPGPVHQYNKSSNSSGQGNNCCNLTQATHIQFEGKIKLLKGHVYDLAGS